MNSLSKVSTIIYPKAFARSLPPGFDGVFDWGFLNTCFGGKIRPADIDAIVERNGHFLIFETKSLGVQLPIGQKITLDRLHGLGMFTVVILWGKLSPESFEFWVEKGWGAKKVAGKGKDDLIRCVKRWFELADKSKRVGKGCL